MKPLQKPRARLHKLEVTVSFAAAARLHAEEVQDSHRTKRRRQREDMEAACATQDSTLHGPLLLSFSMPQPSKSSKETTATVYAVNPLALLCRLTAERPEFGDLLKGLMQGSEVPSLVFYADGTTPGNVLRVGDSSREQMCVCTGRYCSSLLISYPRTAVGGMCWLVRPNDLKKLQAACHGFMRKFWRCSLGLQSCQ